ncbi:MAG: PVC-type heme-binding CxxCH protein [Chthoniobacteraceae bacterium]
MKLLRSLLALAAASACAADANRLTYLDDTSPFWPTPQSPKFTTPQWVGEPGVDAVVILAIDDMRESAKYETFLRPILDRLKRIDGRAPVSIMTNTVKPDDPQFAAWLKEGLSLDVHTLAHPCPMLGKMSLADAAKTYHGGVDLLASVPGNKPVAFRMPCCDSMNSASPRFFAEIFPHASGKGNTLAIDSSVFTLPPGERFAKYFPTELRPPMKKTLGDYAGYIDDYPYPYVIGRSCWEFPCIVPSDWEALNVLGPNSPTMLDDWKAGLDRVVEQRGAFTAVFHPHGWSAPGQWIEFIDYSQKTYGKRVKFLTFREVLERLEKHALAGATLRESGARLIDLNADGFMDVVTTKQTRVWQPDTQRWSEMATPFAVATFGIVRDGAVSAVSKAGAWTWRGAWQRDDALAGAGVLRDFDRDGVCERLAGDGIFTWKDGRWQPADFALPDGVAMLDAQGRDNGLRFADLNGDGFDDVIQSNDAGHAIHLWAGVVKANLGWKRGWPHLVAKGPPDGKVLPFVKDGRDYGAWLHRGSIVWQNEFVATAEHESVSRTFKEIIAFEVPPDRSLADSLAAMRPRPGFSVELVAAEPLVEGPVAFEWDAQGRLWVAEMRDYPLGMDGKGKPGGVVKILTDPDGDGRYDKAVNFLEDLPFPTGVMPWRDGVLISASPDIIFARDTNGDGRADEKRVVFTGFREGNQQHRMNGFEWGLDGWIYGANGDSGGTINGVAISGRDFRFRPDSGEFEPESGQTQYGRRRDDWDNWFGNNNPTWVWHYTISDTYLRRNPKLAVKTTKQVLANYPDSTRVFAVSELPIRFNQPQSAGHVTSGCSPAPYRDELFGAGFATSVFSCEPVHNVVHREVLTPDGATFTSKRADDERDREFLASTDPWFRPVYLKTGPDGALYVADFHRFALEHPEWIAPETQSRLDLRAGADKGRIYRVFPSSAKLRPVPNLAKLDTAALAAALDSPNGWQRDTAQRVLTERGAKDAAPSLRALVSKAPDAKVRVQALATLDTLHELDAKTIAAALRDNHPAVRVQALRVSTSFDDAMLACADDVDFTVRHQLALTLGNFRDERATTALAKLAGRDGDQPQMRIAIMSSLTPDSGLFAKLNKAAAPTAAPAVVLPKPSTPDRAKVIASYASVANLKGDAARGRELFKQQCFICHRLKGEGLEVGPDLAMTADKPIDWLLTAIFDPNAAIEDRYKAQTIKLKAGGEMAGLISAETANNVVLKLPGGVELPVLRGDIASQQPSNRSLMPEGVETVMKPQDVADLLAWIRAK